MKVAVFGAKPYDEKYFNLVNEKYTHQLTFLEPHLNATTARLATGYDAVCAFVNDEVDAACLEMLAERNIHTVALRCAGFNNVDLAKAAELNIQVVRVPEYSPHGVAEHAVAMILGLNRKIYRAYNRVREGNFLLDGLLGYNLNTKTVGVVGTGKIGLVMCSIMQGFGCKVLAYDPYPNEDAINRGVKYVDLETLLTSADIVSLHCPLTPESYHLIDEAAIATMKDHVMIINTSRGALIDTQACITHLKNGKIGALGLDVYEEEGDLFFEDVSDKILEDDVFARLLTFPNVLVTGHQAFFTSDALENIADTTLQNLTDIEQGQACQNQVCTSYIKPAE